ncbi:Gfo/Idh/MocA family protein [Nonomuraea rhizosphaerae]|uniref:Gfo/Idh/MocA family protein n=1 Tax=Nonomuraea rhizosphaerae TaxID=2665663 RepID=UPI001C5CC88E|nr:Gfo/Idh/MocA family oxidoreductase [Nonomuraea rhizosphaerae]
MSRPISKATPIRWGVIGWADIARRALVPALAASPSARLVAVASERGDADGIRRELPGVRVHTGAGAYGTLLARDDVDAVYVAVPNHLHAPITVAAAAAGKHVLCEKPLATSADEAADAAGRCEAAGVVLMEAMMARFNPQHDRVRRLVAEGAIGRPRLFRAGFTVNLPDPAGDIRFLPSPGSGALFDVGVYPVSAARWIFGAEPVEVKAVTMDLPGTGADELSGLVLRFPDERLAVIDCGLTVGARNSYEVVGSEGTISVTRPFASPPFVPVEPWLDLTVTRGGERTTERFEDRDQYALQLAAFHRALAGDGPHPYPPEESISTARIIDMCRTT